MSETMIKRYKEASRWLLRLNCEDPAEGEVADWLRWCEEDERNLQAFERLQADWRDVVTMREDASFVASQAWTPFESRQAVFTWSGRIAAAIVAIAFGLGIASSKWPELWRFGAQEITAGTANKTATLPDGTLLTLRAQAAVDVDFDAKERRLEIKKESEAYFKVRPDPSRPFVVKAGELTVTAIGTAFDVKHEARRTWVTVEEGKVEITAGRRQWLASAGERLEYARTHNKVVIARVDAPSALRWRQGEFAYVKAPLGEVIEEINRYSTRRITMADERVRAVPYTGTVFVQSTDDWLAALAMKYPVSVVPTTDGEITLKSRDGR
jgi:transmembrane sensor